MSIVPVIFLAAVMAGSAASSPIKTAQPGLSAADRKDLIAVLATLNGIESALLRDLEMGKLKHEDVVKIRDLVRQMSGALPSRVIRCQPGFCPENGLCVICTDPPGSK